MHKAASRVSHARPPALLCLVIAMRVRALVAVLGLFLSALLYQPPTAHAERLGAYDYPFVDPLVATVVGTPKANAVLLPELERFRNTRIFSLTGLVDRPVPPVFFFQRHGLEFGLVEQPGPAPLVFVIAGTGGAFNADKNQELARILYAAGFHVIGLPNPTHPNFAVNASTTGVPGRLRDDSVDLYRAMKAAYALVENRIEVTEFHLTGYSLGGTYSAFLAELDSREHAFNFGRVLLLNPAVSLFTSIGLVDAMLPTNTALQRQAARDFTDLLLQEFGRLYSSGEPIDFSGDFIYRLYAYFELSAVNIERLIGIAFRLSAANLAFTSDVLAQTGVIVPRGAQLTTTTSMGPFYNRSIEFTFTDYFEKIYTPFFEATVPGLTPEQMVADADLHAIEPFLLQSDRVGLLTNADDLILTADNMAFLERVFPGGKSAIYPTGGHCGNYAQRDVAAYIQTFFRSADLSQ